MVAEEMSIVKIVVSIGGLCHRGLFSWFHLPFCNTFISDGIEVYYDKFEHAIKLKMAVYEWQVRELTPELETPIVRLHSQFTGSLLYMLIDWFEMFGKYFYLSLWIFDSKVVEIGPSIPCCWSVDFPMRNHPNIRWYLISIFNVYWIL